MERLEVAGSTAFQKGDVATGRRVAREQERVLHALRRAEERCAVLERLLRKIAQVSCCHCGNHGHSMLHSCRLWIFNFQLSVTATGIIRALQLFLRNLMTQHGTHSTVTRAISDFSSQAISSRERRVDISVAPARVAGASSTSSSTPSQSRAAIRAGSTGPVPPAPPSVLAAPREGAAAGQSEAGAKRRTGQIEKAGRNGREEAGVGGRRAWQAKRQLLEMYGREVSELVEEVERKLRLLELLREDEKRRQAKASGGDSSSSNSSSSSSSGSSNSRGNNVGGGVRSEAEKQLSVKQRIETAEELMQQLTYLQAG